MHTPSSRRIWPTLAVAALVAVVGAACKYDPAAFAGNPALSECNGVPAAIGIGWTESGGASAYYGTEGDDVVVITNGPVTFYGLGGDDLICVNQTGIADGGLGASGLGIWILAGDGNDQVFNHTDLYAFTELGLGDDVYESTAGAVDIVFDEGGADYISTGDGDDHVFFYSDESPDYFDGGAGYDKWSYFPVLETQDTLVNFEEHVPAGQR